MNAAPPALDQAVRQWFADHGLHVHTTHYEFDHSFFAWRYHAEKRVFTLWVSEITASDYGPASIIAILKDIDPNALMATYRHVHAHVASNESEFGVHVRTEFSPTAA